jgi:uncharacterized protein
MGHFRKQQIAFFVTTTCNLACPYCITSSFLERPRSRVISLAFAKRGLDDWFSQQDEREIRFYAIGEPTTQMDIIEQIHDYAYQKAGDALRVELQSNGYWSRSTTEWIAENVDITWISFDGLVDVHDHYRPTLGGNGSSKRVLDNLTYLLRYGKGFVGVRPTMTPLLLNRQIEMLDYLRSLGVQYVWTNPLTESVGRGNRNSNEPVTRVGLMDFAYKFLEAWEYAKKNGVFYGSNLTYNFDEPAQWNCRSCVPCPHLTVDGYISACDMAFLGENTPLPDFVYGKYLPGEDRIAYDQNKIKRLRSRTADNLRGCQGCEALYNCAGGCLGEAVHETGDLYATRGGDFCKAVRFLACHMDRNQGVYPYLHP